MALDFESLIQETDQILDNIEQEYQAIQGLILTEDDLKCILFKRLTQLRELSFPVQTQDNHILATKVHSELTWYDENWRLALRPDITIIEPEHLGILNGYRDRVFLNHHLQNNLEPPPLPRKQYEFGGKAINFELKFIRSMYGIGKNELDGLVKDYEKFMRIFNILESRGDEDSVFNYLVIFNKTNKACHAFYDFLNENRTGRRHKIVYKTGNVGFPRKYNRI